jgi:c-di-GMP-binding flagellar brake protein YcgR
LQYYLLVDDQMHPGRLLDLSVHGGLLRAEDGRVFRAGDQLKLYLPIARYLAVDDGDFLRLSAVVRRVLIGGTHAGVSFEHMSDAQTHRLTTFVIEMVNQQVGRRMAPKPKPKAKAGRP